MTDAEKLAIFNGALVYADEAPLASLTENRPAKRKLDAVWPNIVPTCLRAAYWKFALRTVKLEPDPSLSDATFGHRNVYILPDDYLRTYEVSSDEYFNTPLTRYQTERGYILTDVDPLYLRYVSSLLGDEVSQWTPEFLRAVQRMLAFEVAPSLKSKIKSDELWQLYKEALSEARTMDAIETEPQFRPAGSWNRSRGGYANRRR